MYTQCTLCMYTVYTVYTVYTSHHLDRSLSLHFINTKDWLLFFLFSVRLCVSVQFAFSPVPGSHHIFTFTLTLLYIYIYMEVTKEKKLEMMIIYLLKSQRYFPGTWRWTRNSWLVVMSHLPLYRPLISWPRDVHTLPATDHWPTTIDRCLWVDEWALPISMISHTGYVILTFLRCRMCLFSMGTSYRN